MNRENMYIPRYGRESTITITLQDHRKLERLVENHKRALMGYNGDI